MRNCCYYMFDVLKISNYLSIVYIYEVTNIIIPTDMYNILIIWVFKSVSQLPRIRGYTCACSPWTAYLGNLYIIIYILSSKKHTLSSGKSYRDKRPESTLFPEKTGTRIRSNLCENILNLYVMFYKQNDKYFGGCPSHNFCIYISRRDCH